MTIKWHWCSGVLLLVKKNIEFCKNLFRKLKNAQDKADEFIILDYFSLKTIQLLEEYDINEVFEYIDLFRDFEEQCDKNNNLKMPFDKIYGLTHLSLFILSKFKKEVKERDVVYFIFAIQIIICLLALLIFRNTLFI